MIWIIFAVIAYLIADFWVMAKWWTFGNLDLPLGEAALLTLGGIIVWTCFAVILLCMLLSERGALPRASIIVMRSRRSRNWPRI
jgi:hypothetical protein